MYVPDLIHTFLYSLLIHIPLSAGIMSAEYHICQSAIYITCMCMCTHCFPYFHSSILSSQIWRVAANVQYVL
jgi:hypothetical protein